MAGLNPEFWKNAIKQKLYEEVPFLNLCENADEYVIGGVAVHIPQEMGSLPVQRNPTYPLGISQITDGEIFYALQNYAVGAGLVTAIEEAEINYKKKESVLRRFTGDMKDFIARDTLRLWTEGLPAANRIACSGASAPTTIGSTTGNRKTIKKNDILQAATMLDNQLISADNRYLLLSPDFHAQLMQEDQTFAIAYQNLMNLKTNEFPNLYGFKILKYTRPIITDSAGTVKLPESAMASSDDVSAIFWHKDCVESAMGKLDVFDNPRRAEYQGDLVSLLMRMGGRRNRADNKGIGLITAKP
jgi:hypothetical protein